MNQLIEDLNGKKWTKIDWPIWRRCSHQLASLPPSLKLRRTSRSKMCDEMERAPRVAIPSKAWAGNPGLIAETFSRFLKEISDACSLITVMNLIKKPVFPPFFGYFHQLPLISAFFDRGEGWLKYLNTEGPKYPGGMMLMTYWWTFKLCGVVHFNRI